MHKKIVFETAVSSFILWFKQWPFCCVLDNTYLFTRLYFEIYPIYQSTLQLEAASLKAIDCNFRGGFVVADVMSQFQSSSIPQPSAVVRNFTNAFFLVESACEEKRVL